MDGWRGLPADDRLTYLVGLIVRRAVTLDAMTRTVWPDIMKTPMASAWEAPQPMSARLDKLQAALPAVEVLKPHELVDALDLLETARTIYRRRNRFIHDDLMPEEGADVTSWVAAKLHRVDGNIQPPQERVNLEDAWNCERELVRVTWRMWALHMLISGVQSGRADHERRRWHITMRGQFKLNELDGSITHT